MTNYDLMLEKMRALGMDKKWVKMFIKKFADDEKAFSVSPEQKSGLWKGASSPDV